MGREGDGNRVERVGKEIVRAAAVDLTGKALIFVGGSFLAAFALLIWQGGSIPAWTVAILVVVVAGIGALRRAALRRGLRDAEDEASTFLDALLRHEEYSRHVAQSLDTLQRVVSGDISVSVDRYIEQGILEPARDLLMEQTAENVRLSILLPDPEAPEHWWMAWAAGHSLAGKAKYAEPIKDTLSRHAYERGEQQAWPDVTQDRSFQQNPRASAPTRTMLSLPIRRGDEVLGVFNAVSSEPDAFDPTEETYLVSLGGVIAVAVNVWLEASDQGE